MTITTAQDRYDTRMEPDTNERKQHGPRCRCEDCGRQYREEN